MGHAFAALQNPHVWTPEFWTPTGIPGLDLPRGAITEVVGSPSSGRTSLVCQVMAEITRNSGACALVDAADSFDPASAAAAGVDARYLLWVRCAAAKRNALNVVDWLLQGGGFSLIVLDLSGTPGSSPDIPPSTWFRFRRVVENKPTTLLVTSSEACVGSSVGLRLKMQRRDVDWQSVHCQPSLLKGSAFEAVPVKPLGRAGVVFEAKACLLA